MASALSMRSTWARILIPLALFILFAIRATGQVDESGELSALANGIEPYTGAAVVDDAGNPPGDDDQLGALLPVLKETASTPRAALAASTPLWQQLQSLGAGQRAAASIEIELGSHATATQEEAAIAIALLWNGGAYDEAIAALQQLEESGAAVNVGITWTNASVSLAALDTRIGGTLTEAQTFSLDYDAVSGNIFAVVRWGSTTGDSVWTVNLSDDGGLTWTETYDFGSSTGMIDVDCVVVDDYLYIAYVAGNATDEARLRRCHTSTGAIDTGFSFHIAIDAGSEAIEEVALAANTDDYDNRIYYGVIQSNDVFRFAWDEATDGTMFTEESPTGTNPEFGLDMSWDHHRDACTEYLYVSYSGSDGNIHVLGRADGSWQDWSVETSAGSFRRTAITAYEDTLLCAFEYPYTYGTGIRYRISYNCGASWSPGSIAVPDGATVFGYFEPDVDARNGYGTALIYQAEAGEIDPMYYRTRVGFAPGVWSDPILFSDYDVYTGSETALGYLPPIDGESFSHGALYLSLDPDFRTLYFDRPTAAIAACGDTTPPMVEIDEPSALACACDMVQITGSVDDPDGTYSGDRLEYRERSAANWTVADTTLGARSGVLYTWNASGLTQGFYYVRVVATNECALTASDTTFVYHATNFGNAELRQPIAGKIYGGSVCVDGSAWTQSCFDHYTVDYRVSGGGVWNPVDPDSSPHTSTVLNDPLAMWNTRSGLAAAADGDYDVRLYAETECGAVAAPSVSITIDNTNPIAALTNIANCDMLDGTISIVGTASDTNLNSWYLEYIGGDDTEWTLINKGTTNVVAAQLAEWDTSGLRSCPYVIRLRVTDQAIVNGDAANPHRTDVYRTVLIGDYGRLPGDMNCDGKVNAFDIDPFIYCLLDDDCDCP